MPDTKNIVVPPLGPISASIALVSDSPSSDDIKHDPPMPFSDGRVGDRFNSLLSQAGIIRSNIRIFHVMPIHPPKDDFRVFWENPRKGKNNKNTGTKPKHMLVKGIELLHKNLAAMPNLKVIIACGRNSMFILTNGKQDGISKWRGSISIIERLSCKMVSTYHPRHTLKQWTVNPLIVHDLKRAKREVDNGLELPARTLNAYPTKDEIEGFFKTYEFKLKNEYRVSYDYKDCILYCDIETANNMITRISFSHQPNYAISIPFFNLDTNKTTHWFYDEWVWDLIRSVMLDSPIGGQNFGAYDRLWLLKKRNVIINNFVHDTMIAQHNIMSGLGSGGDENKQLGKKSSTSLSPFSLGMLTSLFTREPHYKYEGKITKTKKPTDKQYGIYSCKDSAITCEVGQKQVQTGQFKRNKKFFDHEMRLVNGPIWYMMQRGVKVDMKLREELRNRYSNEVEWLELTIQNKIGRHINVASTQQLAELLYDEMKLKGPKNRSTKAEELFILKTKYPNNDILDLITQHRKTTKTRTGILEAKVSDDGRMRCGYSPTTISGRFKSYENPFNEGTNLQNVPDRRDKKIRPMFMADEGCYLVQADMKGAEIYPVAYHSGDRRMITQLEDGVDIHSETAKIVLQKNKISKSDRDTGKTVRHGVHYDMTSTGIVRVLRLWNSINISRSISQQYLNRIHAYNPSLSLWHRKVEADLSRQNMTLINALGRRIKFFDRYGPDLFRKAINWLAQSCIADLLNMIMNEWFEKYNDFNCLPYQEISSDIHTKHIQIVNKGFQTGAELLMQLHDAFYTQCPKPFIHQHLDNLRECFNHPITINGHTIVIPVEFKVTERWGGEEVEI